MTLLLYTISKASMYLQWTVVGVVFKDSQDVPDFLIVIMGCGCRVTFCTQWWCLVHISSQFLMGICKVSSNCGFQQGNNIGITS